MNYNLLSKYRSELMGVAILLILFCHWAECFVNNGLEPPQIAQMLSKGNCGVDIFFVISGIGLFYSYQKNYGIWTFYKKRFLRLLPTYFFVAIPYWFVRDIIIDKKSLGRSISDLLFISFFRDGMKRFWFVPAIMICYIIFPFLHKVIIGKENSPSKIKRRCVAMVFTFVIFDIICSRILPIYDNIALFIGRIPAFIIGILLGYNAYNNKEYSRIDYLLIPCIFIFVFLFHRISILMKVVKHFSDYYEVTILGFFIMWLCLILFYYIKIRFMHLILSILKWFGGLTLEIYIFHSAIKNIKQYPYHIVLYILYCVIIPVIVTLLVKGVVKRISFLQRSENG